MTREILFEPFAKNDLPLDYMFFQRKYYNTEPIIYPTSLLKPIDMWYERPLFGKIDTKERYVIAAAENLQLINENLYAINFVADAYLDFASTVSAAAKGLRTSVTSMIDINKPTKAYEDINELYHNYYVDIIDDAFTNVFLTSQNKNKITSFKIYVDLFIDFVNSNQRVPISKVAYLASNKTSNRVSGLIIEFAKDHYDNDNVKWKKYLSNDFFADYVKLAGAYGFYVNKHIPWSIVANMNSKNMKKYMANYDIQSAQDCFLKNYFPAEYFSYLAFKKYIWASYLTLTAYQPQITKERINNFIRKTAYTSTFITTVKHSSRPVELIERTWEEFQRMYSEDYMIEKYLQIRLLENQTPLDKRQYNKFLSKTRFYMTKYNIVLAMRYVSKILLSQRKKRLAKRNKS